MRLLSVFAGLNRHDSCMAPSPRLDPEILLATGAPTSLQQEMAALLYAGRGNVIAEQRPGPPAVPVCTASSGEMLVRSTYGAACGSGSETALALGAGFGWRGFLSPAPPPRPRWPRRPLTGSGTASRAARTAGRLRNVSHCSSLSKQTSKTTPQRSACHDPSTAPFVSAASIRSESCCSCHRKAENSPCSTSIDHHSAIVEMVRLSPGSGTAASPARRPAIVRAVSPGAPGRAAPINLQPAEPTLHWLAS